MSVYKKYGIYGIKNKINGKIYVGQTMESFGDRWDCHRSQLRGGYHDNKEMQQDWNKFGEAAFDFLILHDCSDQTKEEIDNLEMMEIKRFKDDGIAYNLHDGGSIGYYKGKHLSEETKRKIGEKNRINMLGRKASKATREKMSQSQQKRYNSWTDEDKAKFSAKLSERLKGIKRSDELKKKMQGNKNGAKYTVEQVHEIRRLYEQENKSKAEISELMGIPPHTVYLIVTYRRWKDV